MNKTLKYSLTTAWIIFSRAYDAHCTAQLTPDLSKEANPLVTVVGISTWTPLLAIISLFDTVRYVRLFSVYLSSDGFGSARKRFSFQRICNLHVSGSQRPLVCISIQISKRNQAIQSVHGSHLNALHCLCRNYFYNHVAIDSSFRMVSIHAQCQDCLCRFNNRMFDHRIQLE